MNQQFPSEVLNIILEYTGHHKYRSGQYMKQIIVTTRRYRVFKILFDKIIRERNLKSFAVLHVSPQTKYVVFDSYNSGLNRL